MLIQLKTLITSRKTWPELEVLVKSWQRSGGDVLRLGESQPPPRLDSSSVCLYGSAAFAQALAASLDVDLVSPDDALILAIPRQWLQRRIDPSTLDLVEKLAFPVFIKSLEQRLFPSRVYRSAADVYSECSGLPMGTRILVSEIVEFESEARAFLLHSEVQDISFYQGGGSMSEAAEFVQTLARDLSLPVSCVVDVGKTREAGWALVEFNPTWTAFPHGSDPSKILSCIAMATQPRRSSP